jgi:hypothetical protein
MRHPPPSSKRQGPHIESRPRREPPLSAHALDTNRNDTEAGTGLTILRYLDLVVLALALPLFALAGLPMLG